MKKSKSKRISLRQKHKVLRKVKEHHRKKRKEAKKEGRNHKKKVDKDPGIPNEWPFKEQELKALETRRSQGGQAQRTKLGWKSSKLDKTSNIPQISDCLGAENLIKLLKNYSRSHEVTDPDVF